MIKRSVLADAAVLQRLAVSTATPAQHTAKPNAPPGYTFKVGCSDRDLNAGEIHKFLPAFGKVYTLRQCCPNV